VIRVLLIGPTAHGGVDSVLHTLTEDCVPEGYCYRRLTTQRDGVMSVKLLTLARALLEAPAAIVSCDIVHVHTASRHSFLRKSMFVVLARMLNRPVVLQIHGGGFSRFVEGASPLLRWLIGCVLRSAQRVAVLSKSRAAELDRLFVDLHPSIIPNPCPKVTWRRTSGYQGRRIVYAGRIEREKGVFDLLQAAAIVSRAIPDLELVVAGTGRIEEVRTKAAELGIAGQVKLTGWLSAPDLACLYKSASVFCLPSYCETLPMVLLEAMAHGLAVVATPVGAVPELIEPQHTGCLVVAGQIPELAQALEKILTDPDFACRLGENAQRRVAQDFSPQVITQYLARLYDSIRKRNR